MGAEQQPGGLRIGVGQQVGEPVGAGPLGDRCQRGADPGAVTAQHVQADRAQRARDRAGRGAVTGVLAGGEDGVGGQLQRDQQRRDPPEAALAPGQRVGDDEHGGRDQRHRVERQRDPGQQHVRRGAECHDECREQRRAQCSQSDPGYVHSAGESVTEGCKGALKAPCERPLGHRRSVRAGGHRPGIRPLRNRSTKTWWSARARAP